MRLGAATPGAHKIAQISTCNHHGSEVGGGNMNAILGRLWSEDDGQDIAEYAVMLAVILVIVVGTIRLIGTNANNVFSSVASSIQ
jgi:Flp pilus assembly pilin Flp